MTGIALRRRLYRREVIVPFLAGPIFVGTVTLLAWFLFTGGITRGPAQIEFVIPAGTAERVAAGEAVPSIPARESFVVGDVLVLHNEDRANHELGPFWIPAGTTLTIPLERPASLNFICTIHPSGYFGLEVRPQNSLLLTLVPTLLLGVPLGGVASLIVQVMNRLEA